MAPEQKKVRLTVKKSVNGKKSTSVTKKAGGTGVSFNKSSTTPLLIQPTKDKLSRVMTPLEAARNNVEFYSNLGIESNDARRQAIRSKRLKARRTIALSPAPIPITAGKTGFSRFAHEIKVGITEHIKRLDIPLLAVILILSIIGILAVHSATLTMSTHRRMDILQIFAFLVGIFMLVGLPYIDYSDILKKTPTIFWLNVAILTYTAIFGFNPSGESNESWISLGFTNIQPAEFSKILFIITLSSHLEKVRESINRPSTLLQLLMHGGVIIGLVLLEKDWGNTLVFIAIFAFMLFTAKISLRYILGIAGIIVAGFPIIWDNLGEFRRRRVLIGFNPDLDPLNVGFQAIQSRSAIASGGLFGQGYMQGNIIQHPSALAEKHNDMIFAAIGQEFGFVGCALVICAFAFLIYRLIRTAAKSKDYSGVYICSGVAGLTLFHFIINIGMALGITPVVGITLPLISYGTSSLITFYMAYALCMTVGANSYKKER